MPWAGHVIMTMINWYRILTEKLKERDQVNKLGVEGKMTSNIKLKVLF
jgi:hypothetical protein